jgi:CHRD domain
MKLFAFTRSFSRTLPALGALAALLGLSVPARAQVVEMICRMDQAQETPPTGSPATGIGFFSIDTVADTITYRILYTGLGSPENAAHIHGFAPPGVAAGILFALPLGALKCGVINYAPAQEANILAGLTYVNIHTAVFGGGEIRGQISELEAHPTLCYGDGSGTACPCANTSAVGDNEGCLHSLGAGARLVAYGNASTSNDTVVLHFLRGPPTTNVLFFQGTTPINGGAGSVFGDGLRCAGGNVFRLGTKTTCNGQVGTPEPGDLAVSVAGAVGPLLPGTSALRFYQAWYRNAAVFCTTSTFNLTNAVQIVWVP